MKRKSNSVLELNIYFLVSLNVDITENNFIKASNSMAMSSDTDTGVYKHTNDIYRVIYFLHHHRPTINQACANYEKV